MKKLFGVTVPIVTPLTGDQKIDHASLERLCVYLIEKGINGIYPCGTTGEVAFLSKDERKEILETVLKTTGGKLNVFSMVGANSVNETIELLRHAEKAGADGAGIVTPYYHRLDDTELANYFIQVAGTASPDFPIYLYGIPQLAVNDITPALAEKIIKHVPNVIGIKYSFPNMPRIIDFMNVNDGKFSVITGPDELFLATVSSGGDGVISGNANVIPEYMTAIWDAYNKKDFEKARKLQQKANRLISVLSSSNNIARYKAALVYRGIIKSDAMRLPFRSLAEDEKGFLKTIEEMDFKNPNTL